GRHAGGRVVGWRCGTADRGWSGHGSVRRPDRRRAVAERPTVAYIVAGRGFPALGAGDRTVRVRFRRRRASAVGERTAVGETVFRMFADPATDDRVRCHA